MLQWASGWWGVWEGRARKAPVQSSEYHSL